MERKIYSSLPSNYLTLAQLQERWLNQHNQNNQAESQDKGKIQQSPNQNYLKQPHRQVVAPSNGTASKSRTQKQYVVKIRDDSETHRLTVAVESDDRRKSVTEIGDGEKTSNLDLNGKGKGKGKGSKSNKKIRKVNPEEREGSGTTSQVKEKATMESEVKEKENGWVKMNEVEERVRVLLIISENGKQKGRLGKMNNGFKQQRKYGGEKKMVWVRKDEI
ncbi:hypothetical protein VNO80_02397 [Phaseolus coccineus]|uniref:Uncharacterized protein n=1 Tax=Phaseolus coccineus TaxID=3886 RepID=A0AAN9NQC4_PHACN